jgi:hypothetical protein
MCMGRGEAHKGFWWGNKPLGRPRHRWEDNIKWIFRKWGMDWIELAQDTNRWQALVNEVMNLRVP